MTQEPDKSMDLESKETRDTSAEDAEPQAQADEPAEVDILRQELEAMRGKYLRALADGQNAQKRAAGDRAEAVQRAQAEIARSLLAVLDNFERTIEAAKGSSDVDALVQGVRIIYDQMLKALGDSGLRRMKVEKGDPFDPIHQQAVAQHASDEVEPQHILHVAQAGYTMGERILRPAMVVVAAKPADSHEDAG